MTLVIPRGDVQVPFKFEAVISYDEMDEICPRPKPPTKILPGGAQEPAPDDPDYQKRMTEWATLRVHWNFLKSIELSKIEWETVDMKKPETWGNYEQELLDAGFTSYEVIKLIRKCTEVNGLDQDAIEQATKDFLAGQEKEQAIESSPNIVEVSTPSGEPPKDLG
jgi:hypothetical protein